MSKKLLKAAKAAIQAQEYDKALQAANVCVYVCKHVNGCVCMCKKTV